MKGVRNVLAAMAFCSLSIAILCLPVTVLAIGPRGVVSLLHAALESFLRLSLLYIIPFVAFNALLTAGIIVEMFRLGMDWTRSWSDNRHIVIVAITWAAVLSGQLAFVLAARQHLMAR